MSAGRVRPGTTAHGTSRTAAALRKTSVHRFTATATTPTATPSRSRVHPASCISYDCFFTQRHGTRLTKDELLAFLREYRALLDRYGHPRETAPEGARPVDMRFHAVAEPVGEWRSEPTGP
ncbi:hypothetical protein ACIRJO_37250 [Streptomyces sp. NPDC102394]|uniref:hypothetical protein n=1 Tax=Streptomyces sp. NPDC102394 TaxID=3366167 RepID=UPI0038138A16